MRMIVQKFIVRNRFLSRIGRLRNSYEVTLKKDQSIQGDVIFSLNRYLLVYGKDQSFIAIPQTRYK